MIIAVTIAPLPILTAELTARLFPPATGSLGLFRAPGFMTVFFRRISIILPDMTIRPSFNTLPCRHRDCGGWSAS